VLGGNGVHRVLSNQIASLKWWRISLWAFAAIAVISIVGGIYLHRLGTSADQSPHPLNQETLDPPVASTRYLPTEIQLALASLCNGCDFADSNGLWSSTDVITDETLPRRRVTKTQMQGDNWVIEYEYGGIATFRHTAVFSGTATPRLVEGSSCIPEPERPCKW